MKIKFSTGLKIMKMGKQSLQYQRHEAVLALYTKLLIPHKLILQATSKNMLLYNYTSLSLRLFSQELFSELFDPRFQQLA